LKHTDCLLELVLFAKIIGNIFAIITTFILLHLDSTFSPHLYIVLNFYKKNIIMHNMTYTTHGIETYLSVTLIM